MRGRSYRLIRTNYNTPIIAVMSNKVSIKSQTKVVGLKRKKRFGIFTKKED